MQFARVSFYILPVIILFSVGCSGSKKVQTIESTNSKPEVVVETTAAIVGGLEALQKVLRYPEKAKAEGVETVLMADVLVTKSGNVEKISFNKETEYNFEEAARNALHQVKFKAGERNGEPINMFITIPVRFEL